LLLGRNVFRTRRHKRASKSSQNTFTEDNEGNEDFLPIILKASSLSLFSSVSLFVLIDAGKNDALGGGAFASAFWHAVTPDEGGLPMGNWLRNQCRSTQNRQSRNFSGLAH
jgi:hypothetical protein